MKKVRFIPKPTIYNMVVWSFAYKESRKRYWEWIAADRVRFFRRIEYIGKLITPILENKYRNIIYNLRFKQ